MNGDALPIGALGTKGARGANALTPGINDGAIGRAIGAAGANARPIEVGGVINFGFNAKGSEGANGDLIAAGAWSAG